MGRYTNVAGLLGLLLAAACVPPPETPTPPSTAVIVVGGARRLSTSTAEVVTPSTTPTTTPDVAATITALATAVSPTQAPAGPPTRSVTPELRATRTPEPTFTPEPSPTPLPTIVVLPTRVLPTRSPTAPAFIVPTARPTAVTSSGADDLARAVTMPTGRETTGAALPAGAVRVHKFAVTGPDGSIQVNLSSRDIEGYQMYLLGPSGRQVGFGTPVGSDGRQVRVPIRGETGTWYVEIRAIDTRAARAGYSLRADVLTVAPVPSTQVQPTRSPTPTPVP